MRWIGMIVLWGWLVAAGAANAAKIEPGDDPALGCVLRLSGVIEPGDAEKIAPALRRAMADRGVPASAVPDELSRADTLRLGPVRICLSSPGGSFAEALRMAEAIHGVLGTAVPRGAECLSACAVLFMAGSHATQGDAGTVANRVLHAGGRLGFHAPSLVVAEGGYSEAEVNRAYGIAVAGIGRLIELSGRLKISPTLIAEMLQTPADEMMMIDTVFEAGRWLIPVAGTVHPREITPLAVSNACNTYWAWKNDRLASSGRGYGRDASARSGWEVSYGETPYGAPAARLDGFGPEGLLSCLLTLPADPGALPDPLHGVYSRIWIGEDDVAADAFPAGFFDPRTPLAALVRPRDDTVALADVADFTRPARAWAETRCRVFSAKRQTDDEPCRRDTVISLDLDVSRRVVDTFTWPSGSRTVIVEHKGRSRINGAAASRVTLRDSPAPGADCFLNAASGNVFCHGG